MTWRTVQLCFYFFLGPLLTTTCWKYECLGQIVFMRTFIGLFWLMADVFGQEESDRKFQTYYYSLTFWHFSPIFNHTFGVLTLHLTPFSSQDKTHLKKIIIWLRFNFFILLCFVFSFLHWLPNLYCRRGYCYFLWHLKKRKPEEVLF